MTCQRNYQLFFFNEQMNKSYEILIIVAIMLLKPNRENAFYNCMQRNRLLEEILIKKYYNSLYIHYHRHNINFFSLFFISTWNVQMYMECTHVPVLRFIFVEKHRKRFFSSNLPLDILQLHQNSFFCLIMQFFTYLTLFQQLKLIIFHSICNMDIGFCDFLKRPQHF